MSLPLPRPGFRESLDISSNPTVTPVGLVVLDCRTGVRRKVCLPNDPTPDSEEEDWPLMGSQNRNSLLPEGLSSLTSEDRNKVFFHKQSVRRNCRLWVYCKILRTGVVGGISWGLFHKVSLRTPNNHRLDSGTTGSTIGWLVSSFVRPRSRCGVQKRLLKLWIKLWINRFLKRLFKLWMNRFYLG